MKTNGKSKANLTNESDNNIPATNHRSLLVKINDRAKKLKATIGV
jgi:hypothetical protein